MGKAARKPNSKELRERLTTELRTFLKEYDALTSRAGQVLIKVFAHVHDWIEEAADEAEAKGRYEGLNPLFRRLGTTIKRTDKCIQGWYYCGRMMAEEGLDPNKTDHRSLRCLYNRRNTLSSFEYKKVVKMIRDGKDYGAVRRVVEKSKSAKIADAERKARRLLRAGNLNKNRLRMEALALLTLSQHLFGSEVTISIAYKGDVKVQVGDEYKPEE